MKTTLIILCLTDVDFNDIFNEDIMLESNHSPI